MGVLKQTLLAQAIAVLWLITPGATVAGDITAPLEIYGRLPNLENVALSPDGSKVAFVHTVDDSRVLAIISADDRKAIATAKLGEIKLRDLSWADDDHLLIITSAPAVPRNFIGRPWEWGRLTVYQLSTREARYYPASTGGMAVMNVIIGAPLVRRQGGSTFLFLHGFAMAANDIRLTLFKVDLKMGLETAVRYGTTSARGWLVNEEGRVVAESDYDDRDQRWLLRVRRDGHLVDAESRKAPIDVPHVVGFGPKDDTLLISAIENGDRVWRLFTLQDGAMGPPLAEGRDLERPIEDPNTHRMIGGMRVDEDVRYFFYDPKVRGRWEAIQKVFEGERVGLISMSADLMRFVVLVDGAKDGYQYILIELDKNNAIPLGNVYEGIDRSFEVRHIIYKAADGMDIPAYLTLPARTAAKRLPLIVLPHDGPAARSTAGYDWWTQAIASQGYAVLQPNFRGSSLDYAFMSAGFGEWGRKMQTDLSDGVRSLAKQGIIDPERVCIVGASYGGYAALAGVALDTGVYRCAVAVAGLSDLRQMLRWIREDEDGEERIADRWWYRFLGVSGYQDPVLDALSPARRVDNINVPVLLIHSRDDTIVPFEQSELMLKALRKANKKVELVELKNEDHWLSRSRTRLQMLQSLIAFLRANNPPD